MHQTTPATLSRCLTVWLTVSLAAGGLVAAMRSPLTAAVHGATGPARPAPTFDVLLVWSCAVMSVVVVAWLWLVATAVVLGAAHGRQVAAPGLPDPVRRLLLAACGVAVVGGLTVGLHTSALATPGRLHHDLEPRPAAAASLSGLPLPDRAASTAAPAPRIAVVRPGDTLWAIASRDLGPGASNAEISTRWHQVHRLNKQEIGPDPDLIHPAQRLRLPGS